MKFKPLHPNFKLPTKGTEGAGAYDIYMPNPGTLNMRDFPNGRVIPLGFAAEVPLGFVALILPRSGVGVRHSLALNNTCGVIDSDYRGEWIAALRLHNEGGVLYWKAGERLLQFLLVPVAQVDFELIEELSESDRGSGGFGSTGD